MTSGNSLTTIGNCMCNSLLHRICYFGLARQLNLKVPPFKAVSSLMTYGDDCADSVRPGFDWFNHTNRQEYFAKHNIVYTMAVKDQDSVPFINIYELSFLKRTPRYDEELDAVLGSLPSLNCQPTRVRPSIWIMPWLRGFFTDVKFTTLGAPLHSRSWRITI